jgi:hypothetical protein
MRQTLNTFVPFVPQLESLAPLPVPKLLLTNDHRCQAFPLTVVGYRPADRASSMPQNGVLVHEPWAGWYFLDEKDAET